MNTQVTLKHYYIERTIPAWCLTIAFFTSYAGNFSAAFEAAGIALLIMWANSYDPPPIGGPLRAY